MTETVFISAVYCTEDRNAAVQQVRTMTRQMVANFELAAASAMREMTKSLLEPHEMGEPLDGHEWKATYEVAQAITEAGTPAVTVRTTWSEEEV